MQSMDYVYAVYKEKSFSAAARKLFMTQPALSAAVKKAEQELGLPIFDRSHAPLRLTDAGQAYIEAAEKIYHVQENLHRYVADLAGLEQGQLTIGGTNFVTTCHLPPLIQKFIEAHPQIHLSIVEASSAELFAQLKNGSLDLVLDSGECDEKNFAATTLCTDRILLGVPKSATPPHLPPPLSTSDVIQGRHLTGQVPHVSLKDFAGTEFLLLSRGNDMQRRAWEFFRDAGLTPRVRLYLNQLMTAYHMAAAGLGAAFLTDTLVRIAAPNDSLNYFIFDHPLNRRDIFMAVPRSGYRPQAVTAFLQTAASSL